MTRVTASAANTTVTDPATAERLDMSPMNLNLWRREGLRALPTRERLESVVAVIDVPYALVLETALAECGYLDDPPPGKLSLDGIVAVSRTLGGLLGRSLDPSESSRLKAAWHTTTGLRTLTSIADQLDPPTATENVNR